MSEIEKGHALSFSKKNNQGNQKLPGPSRSIIIKYQGLIFIT
jgi:hypothetical protein